MKRIRNLTLWILFCGATTLSFSQEKQSPVKVAKLTTLDGKEFSNATVVAVDKIRARITHENGIANVLWRNMPETLRIHFGYDEEISEKAEREEKSVGEIRSKYLFSLFQKNKEEVHGKLSAKDFFNYYKRYLRRLNVYTDTVSGTSATTRLTNGKEVFHPVAALTWLFGPPDSYEDQAYGDHVFRTTQWKNAIKDPKTGKLETLLYVNLNNPGYPEVYFELWVGKLGDARKGKVLSLVLDEFFR